MYVRQSNEDGTYTEKRVYSAEDMESFAKWTHFCGWYYNTDYNWMNIKYSKSFTTDELLKLWEEQK